MSDKDEHPAIAFNRWYETAAVGEPFFPGLYSEEQLRGVCWLAYEAGRKVALAAVPRDHTKDCVVCGTWLDVHVCTACMQRLCESYAANQER
jgi:hypothetical protein